MGFITRLLQLIPEVKTAFFGCDLRSSAIVLAWIWTFFGIFGFSGYFGGRMVYGIVMGDSYFKEKLMPFAQNWTETSLNRYAAVAQQEMFYWCSICMCIGLLYSCVAIMLTVGTHKRSYKLMYPWILLAGLIQIVQYFTLFYAAWGYGIQLKKDEFRIIFLWSVSLTYSFLVIYSYFKQLKNEHNEECCVNKEIFSHENLENGKSNKFSEYYDDMSGYRRC